MNIYSDLDTAIEIMAYKIADCSKKVAVNKEHEKELEKLRNERNEMYNGNLEIIHKIINVYGKELKQMYKHN